MDTTLANRRKLFDERKEVLFSKYIRFTCPCCGYPTLDERGGFDICQICWWEDDGQDNHNADVVRGGPNHHYSLSDARTNFEKYLVMYPPEQDTRIGGADSEKVRNLKQNLIVTFEKMLEANSSEEINILWTEIQKIEKTLRQDLNDTISEYEAKIKAENTKEN